MTTQFGRGLLLVVLTTLVLGLGTAIGQAQQTGSNLHFYGMSQAQEDEIRQKWTTLTNWASETYGLPEPTWSEFHLGSTLESIEHLLQDNDPRERCEWSSGGRHVIVYECDRRASLAGYYVGTQGIGGTGDHVVEEGHLHRGPGWLSDQLFRYLDSKFAEHQGADLAAERARRQLESPEDWSGLRSLEQRDAYWSADQSNRHMGWLGVDWLTQQAGETAYVEYMTERGAYRTWGEAFQAKFGMTPAQFYARFAASRPEIERIVTGATVTEADAESRDGIWLSTPLYPGLNFIGWTEAPIAVSDLFAAIPRIDIVYSWNAMSQGWIAVWPEAVSLGALTTLRPGMGIWLRISEGPPMRWERRVAPGNLRDTTLTGYAELASGHNQLAWVGYQESFGPLGTDLVRVYEWDPAYQRWSDPLTWTGQGLSGRLNSAWGHGIAVQVRRAGLWRQVLANWWPDDPSRQDWIGEIRFWGDVSSADRARLVEQVRDVVAFFEAEYGAISEPEVHVAADDTSGADMFAEIRGPNADVHCGHADTNEILIVIDCQGGNRLDSATFSHEYFHILQNSRYHTRFYTRQPDQDPAPFWFTEGGATYANALYNDHRGHVTYDSARIAWVLTAERISESLSEALVSDSNAPYVLGALASEWLAYQRGERTLLEYFSNRNDYATVEETFEATFGLTLDEFYEEFAEWRAAGFPKE